MENIKAVEKVDKNAFDKPHGFQVQFNTLVLYVLAESEVERDDWIEQIREACRNNTCLVHKYHPGVYRGRWSCCTRKEKDKGGCQNTFMGELAQNASKSFVREPQTNDTVDTFMVIARYKYEPNQPGDLELEKGHEYTVLNDSQPNWWYAKNSSGKEGHIPANFVDRIESIECQKWYYADMSRQEAETALNDIEQPDGTFLVRISSRPDGQPYTLSLK